MRILPKNKWARRFVKWLVIAVGVIVLLLVAGWVVLSIVGHVQLKNAIAESRAMGGSVTWEEVAARIPKTVTQEEGTRLILEAFQEAQNVPDSDGLNPIEGPATAREDQLLPAANAASVAKRVQDTKSVREKLARVALLGASLWKPRQYENDPFAPNYYHDYRFGCRLIAVSALHDANEGRGDAAIADICMGLDFSKTLDSDPLVIARLVQVACDNLLVGRLPFVLAASDPGKEALEQLSERLKTREALTLKQSLDSERASFLDYYERLPKSPFFKIIGPWMKICAARDIRILNDAVSMWGSDWESFHASAAKFPKKSWGFGMPFVYELLKNAELRVQAEMLCARAGMAVELYRRANGKLPEKPGDLVPAFLAEVPKDPFSGGDISFAAKDGVLAISCPASATDSDHPVVEFKVYPKVKR